MVTAELPAMSPAVMAAAWVAALSHRKVTTQLVEEFARWRADPVNDMAFGALSGVPDRAPRFIAVEGAASADVIDVWTGQRAWLAEEMGEPLTMAKASRMAALLNEPRHPDRLTIAPRR